jgi:hypothetical protein
MDLDLGYYKCCDKIFFNKAEACIYAQQTFQYLQWVFHDDVFNAYPWHIEPEQTLDELYDIRAREIREKYDYVIISYSGGCDSNNVLESFIRQGLHIDEIITNHMTQATEKTLVLSSNFKEPTNFYAEHQLHVLPRLNYIKNKCPNTKITVLDMSQIVVDAFSNVKDIDWIFNYRDNLAVGQRNRYDYTKFREFNNTLDQGKSIAMVTGVDKPFAKIENNNFYLTIGDTGTNFPPITDFVKHPNFKVEFFYWGKTTVPLMCKQSHVFKKYVEQNTWLLKYLKEPNYITNREVIEPTLRNVIYTTWDKNWYQAKKASYLWKHHDYEKFYNNIKNERNDLHSLEVWRRGIEYLEKCATNYVRFEGSGENRFGSGFKTMVKKFCIGPMNLPKIIDQQYSVNK